MATVYRSDGSVLYTDPSLKSATFTANGTYRPTPDDGFSSVVVNVPSSGTDPHTLIPSSPVTNGLVFSAALDVGEFIDMGASQGKNQSLVIIPRERFENNWLDRGLWGNNNSNAGMSFILTNNTSNITAKLTALKWDNGTVTQTPRSGTVTFDGVNAYKAACYEYAGNGALTDSFTARIVSIAGSVFSQTGTAQQMANAYPTSKITNTMGKVAVLLFNRTITNDELRTLANTYTFSLPNYPDITNKKVCLLTMDDVETGMVDYAQMFADKGVRPTFGVRLDFLGKRLTIDALKNLQSQGFELAYHGYTHDTTSYNINGGYPQFSNSQKAYDINKAFEIFDKNNLNIHGFIGPNVAPPVDGFGNRFMWYRYGGQPDIWNVSSPRLRFGQKDLSPESTITDTYMTKVHNYLDSVNPGQVASILVHCTRLVKTSSSDAEWRLAWMDIIDYMQNSGWVFMTPTEYVRTFTNDEGCLNLATCEEVLNDNTTTLNTPIEGGNQ